MVPQVLGWLRAGPGQILRFDMRALCEALDLERRRRGATWKEIARELPGRQMSDREPHAPFVSPSAQTIQLLWPGTVAAQAIHVAG